MRKILENLIEGKITIEECENQLKANNIIELDNVVKFDLDRKDRTGFPEAILADGKEYEDLITIIKGYFNRNPENIQNLLITRLSKDIYPVLKDDISFIEKYGFNLNYNSKAKTLVISNKKFRTNVDYVGKIGIITAGTSDISVAEEAKVIIEESGVKVLTSYDIGVAGIHRLFPQIAKMIEEDVQVMIVCAGMEGALPSVVAGLVDIPIIAVPTSVGYGVGADGKTALFAMLQSCTPGIAVVNIDNGFGAGVFALTILKTFNKK